ncbi:HupE/UreJ family protein [Psychromonas algarum]|uniref:HupE/UreJ family protein n=1 Tax=Psychromonas algarum TaxID=2555643 RepID=UPI00141A3DE1|nr:HupE/UreJ family protein [Psychromonas sp. RZ22]
MRYLSILLFLISTHCVVADEIRPRYLQLIADDANTFSVLWKLPSQYSSSTITPVFPISCESTQAEKIHQSNNTQVMQWQIFCPNGLISETLTIDGLKESNLDVLMRVQQINGSTQIQRLTATDLYFTVEPEVSKWRVVKVYTILGIEHILLGFDHLLFVFALLLIIKSKRRLLGAITAFTVAHSVTLALASLNLVLLPLPPVEAVIALSIVFLSVEIVHAQKGNPGIAENSPWLVAFSFGLLHGFGFAGALAEIGLPENAIPLSLLFFNVGVEIGQLAFIAFVLLISRLFAGYVSRRQKHVLLLSCAYMIGGLASFWVIERTVSFFV